MRYERRLRKLAIQQGRCPVHVAEKLACVRCGVRWDGNPNEARELIQLFDRSYGACPCGSLLVCLACNPWPPPGAHPFRDHGLSAGELDRFVALLGRCRLAKPWGNRGRPHQS